MNVPKQIVTQAVSLARKSRDNAYAPYSEYQVGACVVAYNPTDDDFELYTGCNVENGNFTNTIHAEQLAITKAVEDGNKELIGLAVATADGDDSEPCGLCQQHLIEFAPVDTPIYIQTSGEEYIEKPLSECTPFNLTQ